MSSPFGPQAISRRWHATVPTRPWRASSRSMGSRAVTRCSSGRMSFDRRHWRLRVDLPLRIRSRAMSHSQIRRKSIRRSLTAATALFAERTSLHPPSLRIRSRTRLCSVSSAFLWVSGSCSLSRGLMIGSASATPTALRGRACWSPFRSEASRRVRSSQIWRETSRPTNASTTKRSGPWRLRLNSRRPSTVRPFLV